jgi:hypothetical protein
LTTIKVEPEEQEKILEIIHEHTRKYYT